MSIKEIEKVYRVLDIQVDKNGNVVKRNSSQPPFRFGQSNNKKSFIDNKTSSRI